ncbi:glycoside hydrolase family 16 protein [Roseateles violae]|uniref:Glycoside hydrolase family 16 protein n=1 Tax=Roseateles violae TaxID=3058042 RepID=A0ABT8DMV9_9BURK|nr:glycoside hydrolase family 16 protein [Pelomonas sp. PFR6]MDN3919730.1 glycoside hydrolase family 16 protein [Pelomonas sp. PFR6]
MRRLLAAAGLALTALSGLAQAAAPEIFFDDFSQPDTATLRAAGWTPREKAGHPGVEGASWSPAGLSLVADPQQPGNRLLRLRGASDGTGPGTQQVQLCHARKYLEGTYAARVRFSDLPVSGIDGDPVIQTFYAVSPLKHDYDPEFSELDWEYLPNGGWGSEKTRLYGITWQTVRLDPWQAFNQAHEEFRSLDGWHVLMMQVGGGKTRWFIDGRQVAEHGGRNYPVSPMAISFSMWFSPGSPLPKGGEPRVYEQDVDWVFHARNAILSAEQVAEQVAALRKSGSTRVDQLPSAGLESRCDF